MQNVEERNRANPHRMPNPNRAKQQNIEDNKIN